MQRHQRKFFLLKNLLIQNLGEKVVSFNENGNEILEISGSNFWLKTTKNDLIVGFGEIQNKFNETLSNINEGILLALSLLTQKTKSIHYFKGKTLYKFEVEIIFPESQSVKIGTHSILIYPFWKNTKIETLNSEKLLNKSDIEKEINEIIDSN